MTAEDPVLYQQRADQLLEELREHFAGDATDLLEALVEQDRHDATHVRHCRQAQPCLKMLGSKLGRLGVLVCLASVAAPVEPAA
jgi:hypothetical protein